MSKIKVNIKKESRGRFVLGWEDFPDEEELSLDFNPLLQKSDIATGIILHWQSRPKSTKTKQGRCWGIYDISMDAYLVGVASDIPLFKIQRCELIDIPEHNKSASVPTAVIYFPGARVKESNGMIFIS